MGILFNEISAPTTLSEVLGVGSGAISVCWNKLEDAGIFQSDRASDIVTEMIDWIETHYMPINNPALCGPTKNKTECACGCSAADERCALYLQYYYGTMQVPVTHVCCKIPGRN